jgi:TonB family protein
MWFFIDENGRVQNTRINQSSGYDAFDQAAQNVASIMEFSPAYNRDQRVPVWVALPITFAIQ